MESFISKIKNAKESNDFTSYPYWLIIDPKQNFTLDPNIIASMVTGPFFSREDAELELKGRRYDYGKHAVVYCNSGVYSKEYRKLFDNINNLKKDE